MAATEECEYFIAQRALCNTFVSHPHHLIGCDGPWRYVLWVRNCCRVRCRSWLIQFRSFGIDNATTFGTVSLRASPGLDTLLMVTVHAGEQRNSIAFRKCSETYDAVVCII